MKSISQALNIDVVGNSSGATGWATHAVNFAIALNRLTPVQFRSLGSPRRDAIQGFFGPMRGPLLRGLKKNPGDFSVVISGKPLLSHRAAQWIVWETTELPPAQREMCAATRFIWTPSTWGKSNMIANGIEEARVAVVPEGVDAKFFRPAPRKSNRFRFLMVGKWESRKFPEGLLRAFTEEFAPNEPVELYLQAHNAYIPNFSLKTKLEEAGIQDQGNIVLGAPCPVHALRDLYQSADCFVLPTRAEGWGLPILEAMACGVPAIVTNYSAPVDYLNNENGYPLNVARMVEAHDDDFGIHIGMWAEPDVAHLRHLMRSAYQNEEERIEKGRLARLTAEKFSWDHAAEIALERIQAHLSTPA